MRIAFVTPEFPTEETYSGGLANYLGRMTTALAQRGHDVHLFTKSYVANEEFDFRGVTVHRVIPLWDTKMRVDRIDRLAPRSLYAPYQDLKAAWSLWKRWKAEHHKAPFDIVQVTNVLAVGWFFNRAREVPVVTRLSSFRPSWDRAFGVEENRSVRARWWMERKAIEKTKHIYAPTHFVARLTEENYNVDKVDVIETPFYHEEPESDPTEYEKHCAGKPYVLFFGRQTQMKGVHLLAQALPEVMQKHSDMHAVFVGNSGKAPDGGEMHDYIRSHLQDFSERCLILDSVRHDKLYPIVQNANVVALPSLIDNLPNTCLEAMALGRVVLATSGTCFEQLIVDGESGILVDNGSVDALAKGLDRGWQLSEHEKQIIGEKAMQRIAKLHPDSTVPELIRYFAHVAKRTSV